MGQIETFGSPLSDLELWYSAEQQIESHGDVDAAAIANRTVHDLFEAGDRTGAKTWMAITLRILHLATIRERPALR